MQTADAGPESPLPRPLAPYAASDLNSRGRRYAEPPPAHRSAYQRDRDRIIHSTAFRRLEYKTQVFVNHEGDLFRTRLTHSLEVAQIGRTIARVLGLNEDLVEAIALAHDLGHTPFGHAGQAALNRCMSAHGGFEHNLQSLRVVDELEVRYAEFDGLNLCYETREGILKRCPLETARSLGDIGERFLLGRQASLEAQLTNLADQIAYNNHDVDDGLRAGLISIDQLLAVRLFREQHELVRSRYPAIDEKRTRHEVIRRMINRVAIDLIETSQTRIAGARLRDVEDVRLKAAPLIGFSPRTRADNLELKRFLRQHLYRHERVRRMTEQASALVSRLFAAYRDDPSLLPPEHARRALQGQAQRGAAGLARAVADYIAGMTDRFAIAEHRRLFGADSLSPQDPSNGH